MHRIVHVTNKDEFANILIEFREKRNLSQRQVANACDIHKTQMSDYERAKSLPTLPNFCKLMRFFGWRIILERIPEDER